MINKLIIFSGKQYSGKDTVAKIMLEKCLNSDDAQWAIL